MECMKEHADYVIRMLHIRKNMFLAYYERQHCRLGKRMLVLIIAQITTSRLCVHVCVCNIYSSMDLGNASTAQRNPDQPQAK